MSKLKDPYLIKLKEKLNPYQSFDDEIKAFDMHIKDLKMIDCSYSEFDGCIFENVSFNKNENYTFVDCVFRNCDFSNSSLKLSSFHRTLIQHSKGIGTNFLKSHFSYTRFVDCRFSLSNFSESNLDHVKFMNSEVSRSAFIGCKFKDLISENIDFSESDFNETSLDNCDFSSCTLNDINVSLVLIKGLTLNESQALSFTQLLGIKIR